MNVLEELYQVREQMQHLMNHVDLLQADLEQTVLPTQRIVPLRPAPQPSYLVSSSEPLSNLPSQGGIETNYRAVAS